MSTANAPADVQTAQQVVLPKQVSELTEPKFTATQIEEDCPARLQQIGREIAERLKKAEKQAKLAADHVIAVDKLLTEAKGLCDGGGFNKFREQFCPQLGKSQAYALRAIAAGKKTLAEHRTEERKRKRKSRANQEAVAANSGTVPENSNPEPEVPATPTRDGEPVTTIVARDQSVGPVKFPSGVTQKDTVPAFTSHVMELKHRISKHKIEHFLATAVPADVLAEIGKFLGDLAIRKKSEAIKPETGNVPPGNGAVSVEQSVKDMEAKRPARDPNLDADLDASLTALPPEHFHD